MDKKIKIIFILRDLGFGGAERQVVELCKGLDKDRFRITVVLFFDGPGYLDDLRATGAEIQVLSTKKAYKWHALFRLIPVLRQGRFDIVHTYLPVANFLGGLAARLIGHRCVIGSIRNAGPFSWKNVFCLLDVLSFIAFDDLVIANSQACALSAEQDYRVAADKIKVIYNGRNFDHYQIRHTREGLRKDLGIGPEPTVVSNVGRVCRQKGQRYLVDAAHILVNERGRHDIRFLITGKEEESFAEINRLIEFYSLKDYVILLGVRNEIGDVFNISDLFVLPSLWEGLPNVLLEAMAFGVPVIASDIPPHREVIACRESGILVAPADPKGIADAIEELSSAPSLCQRFAKAAEKIVRTRFSLSHMVQSHINAYQNIIVK